MWVRPSCKGSRERSFFGFYYGEVITPKMGNSPLVGNDVKDFGLDCSHITRCLLCRVRAGDSVFFFAEMEENKTSLKQPNSKPNHLRNEKIVYLLGISFIGNFNKPFQGIVLKGVNA